MLVPMNIVTAVISLMAAAAAVASWLAIRGQITAINEQTQAQRDIADATIRTQREISQQTVDAQLQVAQQSVQPYVWADLRARDDAGQMLIFIIGNSGPTVATNVVIDVQPSLPQKTRGKDVHPMHEVLSAGLASLPPGRTISWHVGFAPDVIRDHGTPRRITITADGPHGPLQPLTYSITTTDLTDASAQPPGTLHEVANRIDGLAKAIKER